MQNGGLGGNKKGLVSFYRNKEESAFERHRSRVPFDKAQDSIIAVKKHLTEFLELSEFATIGQ